MFQSFSKRGVLRVWRTCKWCNQSENCPFWFNLKKMETDKIITLQSRCTNLSNQVKNELIALTPTACWRLEQDLTLNLQLHWMCVHVWVCVRMCACVFGGVDTLFCFQFKSTTQCENHACSILYNLWLTRVSLGEKWNSLCRLLQFFFHVWWRVHVSSAAAKSFNYPD